MRAYSPEIEQAMKIFYRTLNEKDRRRYAGIEALKLVHGGILYISTVLECDRGMVSRAVKEVQGLPEDSGPDSRLRAQGAGRKPIEETEPDIDRAFLEVLENHTAGDPQDDKLIWTNLTNPEIIEKLEQDHNIKVSKTIVEKMIDKYNFKRRKAQKKKH